MINSHILARLLPISLLLQMAGAPCSAQTAPATSATASQALPSDLDTKFAALTREEKFDEAAKLLAEQEAKTPDDPDLAVMKANLNIMKPDARSRMVIEQLPEGSTAPPPEVKKALALVNADTSQTGYIGEFVPLQRNAAIDQSIVILKKAAASHPNRLDIRAGISQLYEMKEDFPALIDNHESILKHAAANDYKGLTGSHGKPAPDPKAALNSDMHHYYLTYTRETENPDDKLAFRIAELTTRYFPEDVRGWNDLAAEYSQAKNNPKAIESLMKAHELDKKDGIVIMNIGHLYTVEKNADKAIEWYQKVVDLKDPELSKDAQAEINELKKKN